MAQIGAYKELHSQISGNQFAQGSGLNAFDKKFRDDCRSVRVLDLPNDGVALLIGDRLISIKVGSIGDDERWVARQLAEALRSTTN